MGEPVRIAVMGCGAIASAVHVPVLRSLPNARLIAIADPAPEARARASRIAPAATVLASAEALLQRADVDAVVVTAPSGVHGALARAVVESGRHLYLEKPIASSIAEGRQVVEGAAGKSVVTMTGFNWRFQPLVARAKELVDDGIVGDLREITSVFSEPHELPRWKTRRDEGGGVLLDLGSHHFDLTRWMTGAEVTSVTAVIRSEISEGDEASVRLELSNGCLVSSFFSFRADRGHWLELRGTRGSIRIDRYARSLTLDRVRARTLTPRIVAWRAMSLVRPRAEPSWRYALGAWLAAIGGAPGELPTLQDGLRSLEIVAAAEGVASADDQRAFPSTSSPARG